MSFENKSEAPIPAPRTSKLRSPVPLPRKLFDSLRRTNRTRSQSLTGQGSSSLSVFDEGKRNSFQENMYEGVDEDTSAFTPDWSLFKPEINGNVGNTDPFGPEFERSLGLRKGHKADWSVFSSISFDSPLIEDSSRSSPNFSETSIGLNDEEERSPSPPRYSPPPLPDLSIYDCLPDHTPLRNKNKPPVPVTRALPKTLPEEVAVTNTEINSASSVIQKESADQWNSKPCRISVIMEFDPIGIYGTLPPKPVVATPPPPIPTETIVEPLPAKTEKSPNHSIYYEYLPNPIKTSSPASSTGSSNDLDKFNLDNNNLYQPNIAAPLNILPEHKMASIIRRFTKRRSRRDSDSESTRSVSPPFPTHMPCIRREQQYASTLFRATKPTGTDYQQRWCELKDGRLFVYHEKPSLKLVEELPLERLITVSSLPNTNGISPNLHDLQCFALSVMQNNGSPLSKPGAPSIVWGATTEQQRRKWMQLFLESLTNVFPPTLTANFHRGGWAYVKEGITATWSPGWLLLKDRSLYFCLVEWNEPKILDLRKARKVALQPSGSGYRCPLAVNSSEVLVLDCEGHTLYLQWESDTEAHEWKRTVKEESLRNGLALDDMQLTKENIPVTVDKCLKFIYTHGLLQEGLYRVNGSNSRVVRLLQLFQLDAWSVQLSPEEFSPHDVACTLKRFFRMLPEPLLSKEMRGRWLKAADLSSTGVPQVDCYRSLIACLPEIHRNTLRVLLAHLHAVSMQHEKNRMPVFNLAPIWGPTLMSEDQQSQNSMMESLNTDNAVVKHLIESYPLLFDVSTEELEREKKIQSALKRLQEGQLNRKISGDVRIWIHIQYRNATPLSVTLAPNTTAKAVCTDLIQRANLKNHPQVNILALFEEVGVDALQRPLHPSENVLETVLHWSNWSEEIRKDCVIVLKPNQLYNSILSWARPPISVINQLRFADKKNKTYKKHCMEFSHARLVLFKDAKPEVEIATWNVEDIVWFTGCEKRRPAPTKWVFTFIERDQQFKRNKETPYFGYSVSCNDEDDFLHWIAALVVGEHPHSFIPANSTMW